MQTCYFLMETFTKESCNGELNLFFVLYARWHHWKCGYTQPQINCMPMLQLQCSATLVPKFTTFKSGVKAQVILEIPCFWFRSWYGTFFKLSYYYHINIQWIWYWWRLIIIIIILIFSEYDKPWWRLNAAWLLTYTQLLCNNKRSLEHGNKPSPGHLSGSAQQHPNLLYQRSPFPRWTSLERPPRFLSPPNLVSVQSSQL